MAVQKYPCLYDKATYLIRKTCSEKGLGGCCKPMNFVEAGKLNLIEDGKGRFPAC